MAKLMTRLIMGTILSLIGLFVIIVGWISKFTLITLAIGIPIILIGIGLITGRIR